MSRYFAIQTWVSSHDNEPDYNGQQTGERNVRSVEIPMFTQHGKANVDWFSDEAIAARNKTNKPSISIKDKILPQFKRLQTLRSQMLELEKSYRAGEIDITEYSLLREVIVVKINRAEVLYKKAISVKAPSYEDDESPSEPNETYHSNSENTQPSNDSWQWAVPHDYAQIPCWISDLSPNNSLKTPLKIACKVTKTLVRWSQASKRYIKTLSEV